MLDYRAFPGSGYEKGAVSGFNVAFNNFARMATISVKNGLFPLFNFNGAYITAAWRNNLNIRARGYLRDVLLYDRTVIADVDAPTILTANYLGIDKLTFESFGGTPAGLESDMPHFAMDNFSFTPISELNIDAILNFFDESVEAETIVGDGPGNSANGRLNALRNMLEMAGDFINIGEIEDACEQLKNALSKCDDDSPPPDFVTGESVSALYDMIEELMEGLGCE